MRDKYLLIYNLVDKFTEACAKYLSRFQAKGNIMIKDFQRFWEVNKICLTLDDNIPRLPVGIHLDGDWICDFMGADTTRYYSEYDYQQKTKLECGQVTFEAFGYKIEPGIDFGVIMDASIYGGEVICEQKATPVLRPVVNSPEEIDDLVLKMENADLLGCGLVPVYLQWMERIEKDYGIKLPYGSGLKGCATMLGQICGITNFLTWIVTDPEQVARLISCWYKTSIRYIDLMRQATGFKPGDTSRFSFASDVAGMLSPQMYEQFIKKFEQQIYAKFAGGENDTRHYHADYHMLHLLGHLQDIGVNEVNIDPYIEPKDILAVMPNTVIVGQIPPTSVLLYGTPEQIRGCVKRDIEQAGQTKNLIVSTAGSINPGTSFENLIAICEAVEEYGYIY